MARLLLSLFLGAVITFLLFVLMAFLVNTDDAISNVKKEQIVIELNSQPPEAKANARVRVPPPPPPPPPEPPKQQMISSASTADAGENFSAPAISVGAGSTGIGDPSSALMADGDATPIVRMEPKYPVQAARDGINGYVVMRFTIMEDGSVDNVEVIEAEPKRVFDKEAVRALKKWKYKPRIEEGKAIQQPGMKVRLDFNLENAGG